MIELFCQLVEILERFSWGEKIIALLDGPYGRGIFRRLIYYQEKKEELEENLRKKQELYDIYDDVTELLDPLLVNIYAALALLKLNSRNFDQLEIYRGFHTDLRDFWDFAEYYVELTAETQQLRSEIDFFRVRIALETQRFRLKTGTDPMINLGQRPAPSASTGPKFSPDPPEPAA